jgi:GNAT superfamily N-acetyltransferase
MIFRLSQKLSTKIKAGTLRTLPLDENPFADWSAHLFVADRTQYILLSNTKSLYSTVMYGKGITNGGHFIERALSNIREFMEDDGQEFVYQRFIAPASASVCFEITAEDVYSADAIRLISELSAELACRYNFADDGSGHFRPEDVVVPRSVFLIARLNGRAVACGAVRPLEGDAAELKRMYVEPAVRGRGLAKRLLKAVEDVARNMGYVVLCLETADRQPEAVGLYGSAGYHRIKTFGPYVNCERSLCFEKRLK